LDPVSGPGRGCRIFFEPLNAVQGFFFWAVNDGNFAKKTRTVIAGSENEEAIPNNQHLAVVGIASPGLRPGSQ
jgi:hypothetical protein